MTNMNDNELNIEELTQASGGIGIRTRASSDMEVEFIRSCRAEKMTITETAEAVMQRFGYSRKEAGEIVGLYFIKG